MSSNLGGLRYQDEHLTVDAGDAAAWLNGRQLPLTRKELRLLLMLVQHAGAIVPRETLLTGVWEYQAGVKSRTLDVHVRRLRKHLGAFASLYIETIFGKGYRFQPRPNRSAERSDPSGSFHPRLTMTRDAASPIM